MTAETKQKIVAGILGGSMSAIMVYRGDSYFDAAFCGTIVGFTYMLVRDLLFGPRKS